MIKNNLIKDYNIQIKDYESIEFVALPRPNLKLKNVKAYLSTLEENLNVENLVIYPKLLSIINFKNFHINKLVLEKNNISFKNLRS